MESWSQRIGDFFGPEIADGLLQVNSSLGEIAIDGYVVNPSVSRANNRMQYLFLNGRYIRDRSLQHALSESYRGLLMTGRFPIVFLKLAMPPELVDVNVHPAKLEVRFQEGGKIYSQLLSAIRNKFLSTDLTAKAHLGPRSQDPVQPSATGTSATNSFALQTGPVENQERIQFPASAPTKDWLAGNQSSMGSGSSNSLNPVSYTHLTLPTIYSV